MSRSKFSLKNSRVTAKLLASLNHPNIASIYGIEESDGKKALVLEFIEARRSQSGSNKALSPSMKRSCEAENPHGASWREDDTIGVGGIWQVSARGGAPENLIEVDSGEVAHGPQMLPGAEWVLFTLRPASVGSWDDAQIVVQSLETGARETVIDGARDARYLPAGHLIYSRHGVLFGVAFDADRRTTVGGPVALLEGVSPANATGASHFTLANNGTLVYRPGAVGGLSEARGLVRVDRTGAMEYLPVPPKPYLGIRLSPDGTQVAVGTDGIANLDVWTADLDRGSITRVTTDAAADTWPIWSPNGESLVFASTRDGDPALYRKAADGTGIVERLFSLDGATQIVPHDWEPLVHSQQREGRPAISPNSRWMAYDSQDTGRSEVYVQRFPELGGQRPISVGGGFAPIWSQDGMELFYLRAPTGPPVAMMRVAIDADGTTLTAGQPEELFAWVCSTIGRGSTSDTTCCRMDDFS